LGDYFSRAVGCVGFIV